MTGKKTGQCEGCGKDPRVLTKLNSAQWICRTCLHEIRPSRPKHLATLANIDYLRKVGFNVPDDLTKEEGNRLLLLNAARTNGHNVNDNATADQLGQILDNDRRHRVPGKKIRHFFTEVAGTTYDNGDGSSRQEIIQQCSQFEELKLDTEEDNPHDPNAVKICRQNGQQLGYLPQYFAAHAAAEVKDGYAFNIFVVGFERGTGGRLFVKILVLIADPDATSAEGQEYMDSIMDDLRAKARYLRAEP